jgi:hypothetical protein
LADLNIVDRSILGSNQDYIKQAKASLQERKEKASKFTDKERFEAWHKMDYRAQAALRLENVSLQVNANMIGLDFFELIELQPDEVPGYMLEDATPNIPVTVVSQFGGSATTVFSANKAPTTFALGLIESDKVETQRFDIYQGFINTNNFINNKIAYSITNKLDDMAWVAIAAGIGALDANVWVLDAKIKDAPTTNLIDLSATCKGKITKDFYKAITDHFARTGQNVRVVYAPAARKTDLFDWVSVSGTDILAANTVPVSVQEKIWKTGTTDGALMAPTAFTNMLDGTTVGSIYAYAIADQAPGYFFQKPAFHVNDEKDEGAYHYAQSVVTGSFVIPAYRKKNILKIKIG